MKVKTLTVALLALMFFPVMAMAQMDTLPPGLYAVVGDKNAMLSCTRGTIASTGFNDGFVTNSNAYYRGAKSELITDTRTFVLVINPKKGAFSPKKPFVRGVMPVHMKLLPLVSNEANDRREYAIGTRVAGGLLYQEEFGINFDWEQITDNSYRITVPENLTPGEYAFSFCKTRIGTFDFFYYIFGFTVPE